LVLAKRCLWKVKKLEKELDRLFGRIMDVLESYSDEL